MPAGRSDPKGSQTLGLFRQATRIWTAPCGGNDETKLSLPPRGQKAWQEEEWTGAYGASVITPDQH